MVFGLVPPFKYTTDLNKENIFLIALEKMHIGEKMYILNVYSGKQNTDFVFSE